MSRGQLYSELSKLDVKTIFDIGACDFGDSIKLKIDFPNAEVYAVEADPINFLKHYDRAHNYGIHTFNFGMSDTTGKATFYPSLFEKQQNIDWGYAGSLVKPLLKPNTNEALNHTVIYDTEGIQIPTKRFDDFCKEINVVRIDLLFIDVEGSEYKVMKSLGDIRPKLIFAETHHYQVKNFENEIDLNQFDELMFSLGYEIVDRLKYDTLYRHK